MKPTFVVILTVASCLVGAPHRTRAHNDGGLAPDPLVAARVNSDRVTWGDVDRLLAAPAERLKLLQEVGKEDAEPGELDRVAIQTLIRRRLILREAAQRNFAISDDAVDKGVSALRRRFGDLEALGGWMREQGLDERSLFDTIRAEMLASRVRAAIVEGVGVTDEESRQYYDAHKDDLKVEQVRLQIIVSSDETAAAEIVAALRKGENFGALAAQRSLGQRASRGGDTGWVNADTLWLPLRETVAKMAPRQAHGPLKRDNEFLIVRLGDRRTGRTKTLAEALPEIERRLLPGKQRTALEAWLVEQERKASIEIFPRPK